VFNYRIYKRESKKKKLNGDLETKIDFFNWTQKNMKKIQRYPSLLFRICIFLGQYLVLNSIEMIEAPKTFYHMVFRTYVESLKDLHHF
jgi:uncharacterized membrane protein